MSVNVDVNVNVTMEAGRQAPQAVQEFAHRTTLEAAQNALDVRNPWQRRRCG